MSFAPISTDRLLLRPVRPSDAAHVAARRSDPDVALLQSWESPYPLEQAETLVAKVQELDAPKSDEWWMLTIADAADTAVLGDLAIHPTFDGRSIEIGYSLDRSAWGNGYATEAVDALIARLFENSSVTRLSAMLHPDNVASAQVLERTGFRYEGRTPLSYWVGDDNSDDVLYGMTRQRYDEWLNRPRHAPDEVTIVEIDVTNFEDVAQLVTHKSQERFVSTVEESYADAYFPEIIDGAPVEPWMRAIAADGELVGFVMLALVTEHHPEPYLWRLLIDHRHQRRGIGVRVLDMVVDQCRAWAVSSMMVSWETGRGSPEPLYVRYGFEPTGRLIDGEVEARLHFS